MATEITNNVDNGAGKLARSVNMKFFGGQKAAMDFYKVGKPGDVKWLGRIVGELHTAKDRTSTASDGTVMKSIQLQGDFQATREVDGAVENAGAAYLPNYFSEQAKAMLEGSHTGALEFAVEIGVELLREPVGAIVYTWVVRQLINRSAEHAIERIKRVLAANGKLGTLPAPLPAPAGMLEGPVIDHETIDPMTGEVIEQAPRRSRKAVAA